jgi:hypothetical protein
VFVTFDVGALVFIRSPAATAATEAEAREAEAEAPMEAAEDVDI